MSGTIATTHTTEASSVGPLTVARLVEVTQQLRDACPPDAVVVVTTHDDERDGSSWRITAGWRS